MLTLQYNIMSKSEQQPPKIEEKVLFKERQKVKNVYWMILHTSFILLFTYTVVTNKYAPSMIAVLQELWSIMFTYIGISLLLYLLEIETVIRTHSITFRFTPFINRRKTFPLHELEQVAVRTYKPLREFGGWGFRIGLKGYAYTLSGNKGIQIKLSNGKQFLIGTLMADDAAKAVEQLLSNKTT
jgi:hypothetical protein